MLVLDIEKICRVCLKTGNDLLLLFEEQYAVNGISLPEMISEFTMYTIRRHDDFPHLICTNCLQRVQTAYAVKKEFETSHRKLITYLESIDIEVLDTKPDNRPQKGTQTEETTVYPCEKCDSKFLSYEALRYHRNEFHRGTANQCRLCSRSFKRIADLKCHISVAHPELGLKAHECELCGRKFSRKQSYQSHMARIHKNIKRKIKKAEAREKKTEKSKNETLIKTEIKLPKLSSQEPDENSFGEIEAANRDDNASSIVDDFADTNPLNSEEEEDDKPLSYLLGAHNTSNTVISIFEATKFELNDNDTSISAELLPEKRQKVFKSEPQPVEQKNDVEGTKRRYHSNECEKSSTTSDQVKRQVPSHRQEKPYPCTVCDKRFRRKFLLKVHMSTHPGQKPFKCNSCDKAYSRMFLLKQHKASTHALDTDTCPTCNKSFCSKSYLRKHMRRHTEKAWTCKQCPMQFDIKLDLIKHNETHNIEKPHLCSQCGLGFMRNDNLLIHMRRHNGEKPFTCNFCGKGFARGADLKVHERYHLNVKTHTCTICEKGFTRAYNLVLHMRVHTGEKPYKCSHCPKSFAQRNDMKAHVRRHTGERYSCEVCSASFIQRYLLTQHKLSEHGIEIESNIKRLEKILPNEQDEEFNSKDRIKDLALRQWPVKIQPSVKENQSNKTDEIAAPEVKLQGQKGRKRLK